ncbi:guanine nucleotide exchange protein for ADP-robosylation factor [Physocladia obscura]|uniref:Guanine nucleotide exchange protein for ADP-robosylation factor n=1 Tax=Physocladia obscura TaxID=109957 RepID=A0AAD5X7G5_9FUNG|nr:guanine nucleotide exchange protein for ADP-robosylation factor [Physocladia obscura]
MTSGTNEFDELLIESFQLVQTIFKDYFSIVLHAGGLVEFINCIADFALIDAVLPAHDEIVLTSIQLLQLSANQMVQNVEDEILQIKLKTADLKEIVVVVLVSPQPSKLVIQTSSGQIKSAIQLHLLFSGIISEENFFLKWFPIFSAFSRVSMGSNNPSVRTKCIESLFEVLSQCIQFFDLKCIRAIYRTAILPIFDDLREQFDKFESDDNISQSEESISKQGSVTIWILGLRLTIDLFSDNFIKIAADPETISSILHIALSMMQRRDQTLVATGQICLHQFIQQNCSKFSESNSWSTIVDSIEQAFRITNPFELATCDYSSMKILPEPPASMTFNTAALGTIQTNAPEVLASVIAEGTATAKMYGAFVSLESLDFNQTILKCSVHIELLQSIRDALLLPFRDGKLVITTIPADLRIRLLNCIRDSYTVARCFNANYHLRYSIWKKRLVQQLPNLIKQETISIAAHVKILFAIYRAEGDADELAAGVLTQEEIGWVEKNVKMLVVETLDIMERYVMMLGDAAQVNATNIGLWSPVVVLVFRELLAMDCWWRSLPKISGEIEVNEEERIEVVRSQRQAVKCLVLKKQLPRLFRLAIRMMGVDRTDVRQALQEFIEKFFRNFFGLVTFGGLSIFSSPVSTNPTNTVMPSLTPEQKKMLAIAMASAPRTIAELKALTPIPSPASASGLNPLPPNSNLLDASIAGTTTKN